MNGVVNNTHDLWDPLIVLNMRKDCRLVACIISRGEFSDIIVIGYHPRSCPMVAHS